MIDEERQSSWGILIALYVFCAGVGGGVFLFSLVMDLLGVYSPVARWGAIAGPILVITGALLLLFDLGSAGRAYRLFTSPSTLMSSWMARGAWILLAFIVFGLAYALPAFRPFAWLPWAQSAALRDVFGIVAGILSLLVIVYPGFLFGVLKSVPFWNNGILPLLFFFSGLETGIALLVLIGLSSGSFQTADLHLLATGDIIFIALLLVILGVYLETARHSSMAARSSLRLLKAAVFVFGVVIFGLLLPLALLSASYFLSDHSVIRFLAMTASILLLLGAFSLRYSVIRAGVQSGVL
ncbi:MAG: NrfD/PsrC family molybdoenzyme membrane anchor subunit [Chloroflexota bacterium]